MSVTDIITLILSIVFVVLGALRGIIHSLIGPFSVIVMTFLSVIYFQGTGDIAVSLGIGLIGPLLLSLLLKFLFRKWVTAANRDVQVSPLSSLMGALLTLSWGWVFIIFTLILLAILPSWGKNLTAIHTDVLRSTSYLLAKPAQENLFPVSKKNAEPSPATGDVPNNDIKSLSEDPRFKKVLQDPDIQKEIEAHDMSALINNPRMINLFQQIMRDPATMKRVLAVYSSQPRPDTTKNP